MARVFVSHSSTDAALGEELHRWLSEDGHEAFLDHHPHDGIEIGEEWQQRLYERLRWADAVVCVLTSAYVSSTWCTAEVGIAQAGGSRLLPIRAEPGVSHPLLKAVQHLNLTEDRSVARARLATVLRRVEATGGSGWPDDRSPFPGLLPFETDLHRVFFGRDREIEQLATLLRSPVERAEPAVLLVVGPSGCGKSSLVRAGLLPVMAAEPGWQTVPTILPGPQPIAALARELATTARQVGMGWPVGEIRRWLDGGGLAEFADELLLAGPGPRRRRLLIVVDQFEELLTQAGSTDRARFAALLSPALSGPVQVVATLRPEFLDQLLADPDLAVLPTRVHALRPLRSAALRTVIEAPARLAGIGVDEELVTRLVADTDGGDALPLLAYTLAQLADGVRRGDRLLASRYEQLGGVRGALARQADAALNDAIAVSGRSPEQVVRALLRLVTVDEQGRPTRWRVARDELPGPVAAELHAFVTRRLVTTDTQDGRVVMEVAHEAFLSAWPPLAKAITAASTALRARRQIEQAAADWAQHGHRPDRLWERGQLAAALADTGTHLQANTPTCRAVGAPRPPTEQSASSTSTERAAPRSRGRTPVLGRRRVLTTDHVELSQQARDFLAVSIRRNRRRRRRSTTVLSVLLVAALAAAGIAVVQQRASEERQRLATAELLLTRAEAILSSDPRTALQLGEAGYRIRPGPEVQAGLAQLLLNPVFASGHSEHGEHSGHRGDGSAGDDETGLWNAAALASPRGLGDPLLGHTAAVLAVAFTSDGRVLATASDDRTVLLWDVTDPARPRRLGIPLTGHTAAVRALAFAADGRTLATASADHTVILWDLTDPARPGRLADLATGHTAAVSAVAFAPDGRTLATASSDQTTLLWDLTQSTSPRPLGDPLTGHTAEVSAVAFAPDGRTLATGSTDRTVLLWDVIDPARPHRLGDPLTAHTAAVSAVAFTPDGRTLTVAGRHRTVAWDVINRDEPRRRGPRTGNTDLSAVAFAADGRTLATANSDRVVHLWDLTNPNRTHHLGEPLTGRIAAVSAVTFAPAGRTLVTANSDGTVLLWDLTGLNELRDHPLQQACALTRGGLSPDEWDRHIPDLEYLNSCAM